MLTSGGGERHARGKEKMPVSKFKVVAGSVSVAVALGAGTAIAGADSDDQTDSTVDLDDVVQVSEVGSSAILTVDASVAQALEALDEDSFASPFDQDEETDDQETVETETIDDVDTADDTDTDVDTVDETDDTDDTVDTTDDTQDTVETADETDDTAEETNDTP